MAFSNDIKIALMLFEICIRLTTLEIVGRTTVRTTCKTTQELSTNFLPN